MNGLKQIQVVGDVRSWFVVALDGDGNVWYGQPQRPVSVKIRGSITWSRMEEEELRSA